MSFSSVYLTRRFVGMNYRDLFAVSMIGSFVLSKVASHVTKSRDNESFFQHLYTDDESDITFRNTGNKTDQAVRMKLAKQYKE